MKKHVLFIFFTFFFMPPLFPAASNAFRQHMPNMAKGFKKSLFDKETSQVCEKKMKEPIDLNKMKMIHNGPVLGEALYQATHMAFATAMGYIAHKALSGAECAVNDTRDWVAAKNGGGIKAVAATAVEGAIVIGAPLGYGKMVAGAIEAGITAEASLAGHCAKSPASNPFVIPTPIPLSPVTGAGTMSQASSWMTEANGRKAIVAGPVIGTAVYAGVKNNSTVMKIEAAYSNAKADLSSWDSSSNSTKAAACVVGAAAATGATDVGVFAAVEIAAQAARAWGYAQIWCP